MKRVSARTTPMAASKQTLPQVAGSTLSARMLDSPNVKPGDAGPTFTPLNRQRSRARMSEWFGDLKNLFSYLYSRLFCLTGTIAATIPTIAITPPSIQQVMRSSSVN